LLAATACDRVIAWQGVAGAGKSYALNQIRRIAEAQGYIVRGFAPSAEAAKSLGNSAQIQQTETVAALLCVQPPETPSQFPEIWVVDEAGLLSAKDALALLTKAMEQQARVILVGDTRQLSAVEAGNPFKSLQQAGMATAHLNQSLRQKHQQIKAGVDLIAAGKITEGIHQLKPYIHQVSSEEARSQAIARDYLALTPEERRKTLLLAGTNRERLAITQAIRKSLKSEGQLGQGTLMQRLKAKDLTTVQMEYAHHFQIGDVLIPHASYKRWGLERGQRYEVIAVDVQQNGLTLRAETEPAVQVDPARVRKKSVYRMEEMEVAVGDRLKWTKNHRSPTGVGVGGAYPQDTRLKWTKNQGKQGRRNGQEFEVYGVEDGQVLIRYDSGKTESLSGSELAHLDYALVSTTYGAQGKSAERVIGTLDQHVGRESFYVTVSRVKHDLRLYASENLDRLILRTERSQTNENPRDFLHPSSVENSRIPGILDRPRKKEHRWVNLAQQEL
jgi:ATP-dependent exoDNAse (exonuclease V) alpha subunit